MASIHHKSGDEKTEWWNANPGDFWRGPDNRWYYLKSRGPSAMDRSWDNGDWERLGYPPNGTIYAGHVLSDDQWFLLVRSSEPTPDHYGDF